MARDLESRVQGVEEKLNRQGERIASMEGRLSTPPPEKKSALNLTNTLISAVLLAFLGYWGWLGNSIVSIRQDISSLQASVADLEKIEASDTFSSAAESAKSGDKSGAAEQVKQATLLLGSATQQRVPALPGFFDRTVSQISQMGTVGVDAQVLNAALEQLAEYRSALRPEPKLPNTVVTISSQLSNEQIAAQLSKVATVFTVTNPGIQFFAHPPNQQGGTIENGFFVGGRQNLEGMTWINVTFIRTAISYEGTLPARLQNVTFIQCTFTVPQLAKIPNALLEYAALEQRSTELTP